MKFWASGLLELIKREWRFWEVWENWWKCLKVAWFMKTLSLFIFPQNNVLTLPTQWFDYIMHDYKNINMRYKVNIIWDYFEHFLFHTFFLPHPRVAIFWLYFSDELSNLHFTFQLNIVIITFILLLPLACSVNWWQIGWAFLSTKSTKILF